MSTLHPRVSTSNQRLHHAHRSHRDLPPKLSSRLPPQSRACRTNDVESVPWQHMAHTYTWVVEQEFITLDKHSRKTEQWILEQQMFLVDECEPQTQAPRGTHAQRKLWQEMAYSYEVEAEQWMRHEEEVRRVAAERERRKARVVQEEMRRIENRIRQKREAERRRITEEKTRIYEELQMRHRRDRYQADQALLYSWQEYEARWAALTTSAEPLTFSSIPWPLVDPPVNPEGITPTAIILFLLSPLHSQSQTRKDRLRSAQLRWHPDRFRRLMSRVKEEERAQVDEGVGIVARCLNDMMARETTLVTSRQAH
ncbi:hypothetical protein BDZ94DRAFT_1350855 [Collybia nuda]|uniref:Uncharacterized protein n=1 Tax=Collybia nuda TaxID=64659 RepID=A0A9P5YAC0_9AGAR|nr:hypothetical protein BDZ94DRAFT_1350855 [Collybia nuda]